ncbi:uncharacterized protein [Montipora capricornis]|uniref:uncharacterized protein n=1 Tax=Montipora capricornis TaxID=246305 RepID=UPI0035F11759
MRQKQFEFQHQLELAKLEAERQLDEAREKTEMAQLECKLEEREYSCLLSEHDDDKEILHGDRRPTTSEFVTKRSTSPPVFQHNTQASGPIDSSCQAPTFGNYDSYASASFVRESAPVMSEGYLASIASAMERITAGHGLPPLQVLKFDGSPEVYPLFRQRFYQLIETKALDEQTKMAHLLQFLEGPALHAVQRYEAGPGGLNKALSVLQNRFGQPFKIMKARIDALTKGPVIAPQDKERFADTALVMYDTLALMNCLTEMNASNLEKVILRLPRWLHDRFREHLAKLQKQGIIMPTFLDAVKFFNDRAEVANHPFFTQNSYESRLPRRPEDGRKLHVRHLSTLTTNGSGAKVKPDTNKAMRIIKCMLCSQSHPLYCCDAFKSKSVEQRREFVFKKNICFNCGNSRDHLAKSCTSTNRCKVPGCGRPHHSLLHQSSLSRPDHQSHLTESTSTPAIPTSSLSDPSVPTASVNTSVAEPLEIFLQIIPLKVIGKNGRHTTTYALIDSASDVTLIDPSLVQQPGIEVDGQRSDYVTVRNAWALRDLTIPLKHMSAGMETTRWIHLQHVPFHDVERRKVSILIGTGIQEAFIPLEVRRGKPNEPFALRSCLGWSVLSGSLGAANKHLFNLNFVSAEDTSLSRQLEEFWRVEPC